MFLKILLFLIAFLVGADELMLGPILAPIGKDLGVQPERITLFITAYSVALAMVAPLLGSLSDRLGRIKVMLPAALLFGAASVATGLVENFEWGLASRVLTGLASAGMLPIAFAMAADSAGTDAMKRIAWVQAGLTLGMIASPAVGALLTQWLSWRAAFILLGVCAWCVAAALALLPADQEPAETSTEHQDGMATRILAIPGAVGALLAMCLGLGGGIGLFNLVGQHLRDTQDWSIGSVGGLYALLGIISVIGNLLMPRLSGRVESGRTLMRMALVVCLLVSVWFYLYPAGQPMLLPLLLIVPLLLWALAGGIGSPALQGYIAQLSAAHRGMLMSLAMTMMHIGVALWSGVAGFAYSAGPVAMAALAILLFGSAIVVLRQVNATA
ncbi:TPA: MFS transporter [Aeromonas salmonicida]|uniref:MFS transporter n=2 Tax=Aeromonas salmonicida subsp. salmonicida TaxID=29491 RepID=A0ABN0DYD9_AERSS|nr:MFS transporter [Aeromonas salmonicida]ABO89262.1 putative MFS transporter [Aeromonas salmonicida subsp. salmonicida A449]ASI24318.1 MFS transporter [Aeromonas salmonicida]ASI28637.1 MFS transporter [Aeromonas salmonicida]ASI32768.1 MFS transporter [Aeromonas salmonicida]ATD40086.1 MFS transporter [Aeromonas salmonicida subsp. masoucida]